MIRQNINSDLLDQVVAGAVEDIWYHYGISSREPLLQKMRNVEAVIIAGSGERTDEFARHWSVRRQAPLLALPRQDRFVFRYVDKVIFSSHGMGMPSAAIALQELMKMVYFLKDGDLTALDNVFWMRVGTSGGLGVPPGTVVISQEALQTDMKPYRLLNRGQEYYFDARFPSAPSAALMTIAARLGIAAVAGRTVGSNDFYLEQGRCDGAVSLISEKEKDVWLRALYRQGVTNIEMETPMVAGLLNHWGFPRFAAACAVIVDRLQGDQVISPRAELLKYVENAERLLWGYLEETISSQ
ncbi:MAG TPA: uridine phosphorylase [Patescibacteria group bacterium]|nr:uridine phosphorylase [Patescibacteria group bacterium]